MEVDERDPLKRKSVETKRLELRPYRLSDYETWRAAYLSRRGPKKCTVGEFKKVLKRHEDLANEDKVYIYGAFDKKTGVLVAGIDIGIIARDIYQMANLGYQVHPPFRRNGYGAEASQAGLKIGFKHLKLHRLEAAIDFDNRASVRLAKSIGMRYEGIKKSYLFENGKWVDQIIYVANP